MGTPPEMLQAFAAAVRASASIHGGLVRYEYTILPNVINLRNLPALALAGLRNIRGVLRVNEDRPVQARRPRLLS